MQLRKFLTVGAAVLTAGLLSLTPVAQAGYPHGPIVGVDVNGVRTTGTAPIGGIFKSGTITTAGFTASCVGGTASGVADRGPNTAPQFRFTALSLTCASVLGVNATMTLAAKCTITTTWADPVVHDIAYSLDSGPAAGDPGNVDGAGVVPANCVQVTIPGGCTFTVDGTFTAEFDEYVKTVGTVKYQDFIMKGNALFTRNPNVWCLGLYTNGGAITLNRVDFNVKPTAGITGAGIDIYWVY
jgi:hypothetical protein